MPLDPLKYSDPIVRVYEACVDEVLVNLAKHFSLASIGKTGSWEYEVMMLSKLGAINKETAKIIAKRVANNEPMIEEAVKAAMLDALNQVEPDLKKAAQAGLLHGADVDVMDGIQNQLKAYSRQARNQLNLVNTVMLEGTAEAYRKGVYAAVDIVKQMESAQDILNVQTGKVVTGVATPQQALKAAVRAMADNGITGFVDRGGHKWSAEAYVRMDIKTTVSNAANQAVMDRNASYGNDIVWPRINATARPGCYPWQGQLISMGNRELDVPDGNGTMRHVYPVSKTTYGQPAGIWGINCHHGPMNVFIPDFSYVRGEQNKKDQAENDRLYQLTQEQRRLERKVRYAKRDAAMFDAAGDKESAAAAGRKVREAQKELRNLINSSNGALVRQYDREWVLGGSASKPAPKPVQPSVQRAYGIELDSKLGRAHYDAMMDLMEKCPSEDFRAVWENYQRRVYVGKTDETDAFCDFRGNISISLKHHTVDSSYEKAYQVIFHESGHSIDVAAGRDRMTSRFFQGESHYSTSYKNGLFGATIKKEIDARVDALNDSMKKAFKEHGKDIDWLEKNGYINSWERNYYETKGRWWMGDAPKYSKSYAYEALQKEIRQIPKMARADLSDIMEGATKGKIRCGFGHGVSYWRGEDWRVAAEAFAEMIDSTVCNPESMEVLRKYLPESCKVFDEMIKDLK